MATPTLTLLNAGGLTDGVLSNADSNTGWNDLTTADTDIKVEGTGSMSGIYRTDGEQGYYDAGSAPVTAAGKILRGWILTNNLPYMGTEASDPYKLLAYDGTTTQLFTLFGSDTYPGGWVYFWQDMDAFTSLTLANVQRWGTESGHASNGKNVINTWMDVLRYMDGYYLTGGTSGDKVTFATTAATDLTSAYGIIRNQFNVFFCTGTIQIGNGATTTYFESDGQVVVFLDTIGALTVPAGLYEINAQGTGCNCVIKNSVLRANGTGSTTRFVLDFSDTNATVSITDNLFNRAAACTFALGQTVTGNTFDDCGIISPDGADLTGCIIKNSANTAALHYDYNADPNGELDNIEFISAGTGHAIELGTNCPSAITLSGHIYTGYASTDGSTGNEVIYNNSGKAITITVSGGATPTIRNGTGASTTVISGVTVTLTGLVNDTEVTVYDAGDGSLIAHVEDVTGNQFAFSDSAGNVVDIYIHKEDYYRADILNFTIPGTATSVPVSQRFDPNYRNP